MTAPWRGSLGVAAGACVRAGDEPSPLDGLGEAEVEHFHGSVRRDLDVRGLQVAVNDAFVVRDFERVGDLSSDR